MDTHENKFRQISIFEGQLQPRSLSENRPVTEAP